MKTGFLPIFLFTLGLNTVCYGNQGDNLKDFSTSQIVTADQLSDTEQAALNMLVEEIEARTALNLSTSSSWPESSVPVIVVGVWASFNNYGPYELDIFNTTVKQEQEGFTIKYVEDDRQAPAVFILGNDSRGMLYGIGHFLRKSSMRPNVGNRYGTLLVPEDLNINTHPAVGLRGHP